MKGIVEIYGITSDGQEELVYKKSNLAVVGFSEHIVNFLTTPSSIQQPTDANISILDVSNYGIQAFSMSKGAQQFKQNQHEYKTVNILHNTTLAASDMGSAGQWSSVNLEASSFGIIEGPTIDSSGALISAATSGAYIYQGVDFSGVGLKSFEEPYFSGTDFTFSVDLKLNRDNPPVTASGVSAGSDYSGYSHVELKLNTNNPRTAIRWDASGKAYLQNNSYTDWNGGIQTLSNDWYRVFVTGFNKNAVSAISAIVYPSIGDKDIDSTLPPTPGGAGSIYISRPQLELGRVPTNYINTQDLSASRDTALAYSLLNATYPYGCSFPDDPSISQVYNYYVLSSNSLIAEKTLSAVYGDPADKGVSAYGPPSSLDAPVNYMDRELTPGAITPVEEALGIKFTQGQIPAALGLSSSLYLSSFRTDWNYTTPYIPAIGRHVAYLGAYVDPSGFPTLKTQITYIDGDSITARGNENFSDNLYRGVISVSGGIDRYGYWTLSGNGGHAQDLSPEDSRFIKQVDPTFSSTGQITYVAQIGNSNDSSDDRSEEGAASIQKDSPLLNIFGGVTYLGLWGLDLPAIRANNNFKNPPYGELKDVFDISVEPTRKYKLFNKIHLSDNVVKCEGSVFSQGVVGNYTTFSIRWRLAFL